jgi:hypothetical protein
VPSQDRLIPHQVDLAIGKTLTRVNVGTAGFKVIAANFLRCQRNGKANYKRNQNYRKLKSHTKLLRLSQPSSALSRPMTGSAFRVAVSGFCQRTIRTDACLSMDAPEQAFVARRHARIGFGENELALPAQRRAQVRMMSVEAIRLPNHETPPDAALKIARFSATRESWTL